MNGVHIGQVGEQSAAALAHAHAKHMRWFLIERVIVSRPCGVDCRPFLALIEMPSRHEREKTFARSVVISTRKGIVDPHRFLLSGTVGDNQDRSVPCSCARQRVGHRRRHRRSSATGCDSAVTSLYFRPGTG